MSESAAAKSKPSLTRELAQHLEALKLGGDGKKPEKKRPNKHTDRAAWNAHFEREIAVQLASSLASSKRSVSLPSDGYADTARHFEGSDIMDLNQQLALTIKEMIEREGSLIAFALDKMVYANFEADWATLGSNKKKELVLEGLYRGACAAPRDNSRVVCPEMTVNGLAGDGEHNLIRLVKRLIEHDPTGSGRVKSLFLYPHPYINDERYTEGAPDFTRAMFYQSNLFRTYYIIETLRGVMEAYYKIAAEPITIAKTAGHHCPHKRAPEEQPCCPGPDALNDAGRRVDQSQCKEEAAVAVYACYSCNRVKDRDALKSCGKCRLVRYCSGECQKKDWKEHKKICGVTRFDPALLMPKSERPPEFIGCPATVDGYLRTPALWRQIEYLSEPGSQTQDYHFDTRPEVTRSVRVIHPPRAQIIFLVARRRAMASGDPAAVNKMLSIVEFMWREGMMALTLEQIRGQFEREYRVHIQKRVGVVGAGAFAPPTQKELDEERAFQRQRLAMATFSEEDVYTPGPFRLPTRREMEEELQYQEGMCDCCRNRS